MARKAAKLNKAKKSGDAAVEPLILKPGGKQAQASAAESAQAAIQSQPGAMSFQSPSKKARLSRLDQRFAEQQTVEEAANTADDRCKRKRSGVEEAAEKIVPVLTAPKPGSLPSPSVCG